MIPFWVALVHIWSPCHVIQLRRAAAQPRVPCLLLCSKNSKNRNNIIIVVILSIISLRSEWPNASTIYRPNVGIICMPGSPGLAVVLLLAVRGLRFGFKPIRPKPSRVLDVGDCQNDDPVLGPYYNTGPNTGPNLVDPKRDHNFDNPPC